MNAENRYDQMLEYFYRCWIKLVVLLTALVAFESRLPLLAQDNMGREAIDAIERFSQGYQGFRIEYEWEKGVYDRGTPKMISEWNGFFAMDNLGQAHSEQSRRAFGPDGPQRWDLTCIFAGNGFWICSGIQHDSPDGAAPALMGYVKSDRQPGRRWSAEYPPIVMELNEHDEIINSFSELLEGCSYNGSDPVGESVSHSFSDPQRGEYTITLDRLSPPRIRGVRIEKRRGVHSHRGSQGIYSLLNVNGITALIEDFQYDEATGVCVGWKQREVFTLMNDRTSEQETRFRVTDVQRITEPLNPLNIRFELVPIQEGARFAAQDEPALEYRWMNNRVVKVVDQNTLQNLDGSRFQPGSQNWIVMGTLVVVGLLGLALIWKFRKR